MQRAIEKLDDTIREVTSARARLFEATSTDVRHNRDISLRAALEHLRSARHILEQADLEAQRHEESLERQRQNRAKER